MDNFFNDFGMSLFRDRYAISEDETVEDAMMRIAEYFSHNDEEKHSFFEVIHNKLFVPAGRAWRSANTNLTGNNCYMLPCPEDSRQGILHTLSEMVELMAHGGGVGINISSLRPENTRVAGVDGTSSGVISWAELYSIATGLIHQGGSRRGALMLSMHVWHPDIQNFIHVKENMKRFTNANLSVMVSDDFMHAVRDNAEWDLMFPDTSHPYYDQDWTGDLSVWIQKHGTQSVVIHKTMQAVDLWNELTEAAWQSAEPGLLFWTTAQQDSNSEYHSPIIGVNPCAEQALPAYGVCNLGHLNLAEMVDNGDVDWKTLHHTIRVGVRFLDNVIDKTNHVLQRTSAQQNKERRIGLGVIGYHDMLMKLGMVYGSSDTLHFTERLFMFIRDTAYQASIDLAAERGPYPAYDFPAAIEGTFLGYLHQGQAIKDLRLFGIRNSTILTIAPTGTVGQMYNRSTGIEPHFAWEYERTWDGGTQTVRPQIIDEVHNKEVFVSAMDISPKAHVDTLTTVQEYIDSSISKTVNLPAHATVDDVRYLYMTAWENGAKGITVYRDGSRDKQVLHVKGQMCLQCGAKMINEAGCFTCPECGNAMCSI